MCVCVGVCVCGGCVCGYVWVGVWVGVCVWVGVYKGNKGGCDYNAVFSLKIIYHGLIKTWVLCLVEAGDEYCILKNSQSKLHSFRVVRVLVVATAIAKFGVTRGTVGGVWNNRHHCAIHNMSHD